MKVNIGFDADDFNRKGLFNDLFWDRKQLSSPHILVIGDTGTGKSTRVRQFISGLVSGFQQNSSLTSKDFKIHIFDVHDDLKCENESSAKYNEIAKHGINPLELSNDPEFGGVRKRIASFIDIIEQSTHALGGKQVAMLRNILTDVYRLKGFNPEDPDSWVVEQTRQYLPEDIVWLSTTFEEKDKVKALGAKWDPERSTWYIEYKDYTTELEPWAPQELTSKNEVKTYPTLDDALNFARQKLKENFVGLGAEGVIAMQNLIKKTSKLSKLKLNQLKKQQQAKAQHADYHTSRDEAYEKAAEEVLTAVDKYIYCDHEDEEIDNLLKYSSKEVLKSVVERLENFKATGIFKSINPEFVQSKPIRRHRINALNDSEQKLFVLFQLRRIFEKAKEKGETNQIRDVIVLDESAKFFDEKDTNPLNKIALEARKYGILLIAASQSPTHFSADFISSVGTKICLGLDATYWAHSANKLNTSLESIKSIRPRKDFLVHMKIVGEKPEWKKVLLDAI